MLRALAATGGVITSAGILLAAVFTVLGVLPVIALLLRERFWWPERTANPAPTGAPVTSILRRPVDDSAPLS